MSLLRRRAAVAVVTAVLLSVSGVLPASACACGGAVPLPDTTVQVDGETSLVWLRDGQESITMQLTMLADADETALVVPTPTPATVTSGAAQTFTELEGLAAPTRVVQRRWWPSVTLMGGAADGAGAPTSSAPSVLDQVRLGPLEATTLAGGDVEGLVTWLRENGYDLGERMTTALRPYVADGWAFVAMRLVGEDELEGDLDPVTMTFASDRLVYPMRMSGQAQEAQHVDVYVLADHRVQRADPDAIPFETPEFAGWVGAEQVSSTDLAGAVGERAFLTAFSWTLQPEEITSDFLFAPADSDAEVRRTETVLEDVRILGVMAGPFLLVSGVLVGLALVLLVVVLVAVRAGRRRPAAI